LWAGAAILLPAVSDDFASRGDAVATKRGQRMSVLKLTKRSIDALEPTTKAFIAFDSELPGFGVRVMPSGLKTFVFEYRPNGGGRAVSKRRLKLGRFGPLTVDGAREKARGDHARVLEIFQSRQI